MPGNQIYDQATEAAAEEGIVLLDGPGGVAISMTADAAELSGSRISDAALRARKQKSGESSDGT